MILQKITSEQTLLILTPSELHTITTLCRQQTSTHDLSDKEAIELEHSASAIVDRLEETMNIDTPSNVFRLASTFRSLVYAHFSSTKNGAHVLSNIDTLNTIHTGNCCALHDYCDGNEFMIDAFYRVFNRHSNAASTADTNVINKAWTIAIEDGYSKYSIDMTAMEVISYIWGMEEYHQDWITVREDGIVIDPGSEATLGHTIKEAMETTLEIQNDILSSNPSHLNKSEIAILTTQVKQLQLLLDERNGLYIIED